MLGRQLPSLTWNSANQLTIAYSGDNVKLDEVIPVEIAEDGECYFFYIEKSYGPERTLKAQTMLL